MNTDSAKQNRSSQLEIYKDAISGIEFMEEYMEDPAIFNSNSVKLKSFLIQSFSYLHPHFHYLSFLNTEDVEMEITKAAKILQILPVSNTNKLFDNMVEDDIKKFWDKFFSLFKNKRQVSSKIDSIFTLSWEGKINFFKDMKATLNYLNYEFSILNNKRFSNSDINEEINNWKKVALQTNTNQDKSLSFSCDEEEMIDTDIDKLITDLKQLIIINPCRQINDKQNEPEYVNFFNTFIFLTKDILQYRKNISIINSTVLDSMNCKMLLNDINFSRNLYFIKKCNNFVSTLKSKQICT